MLSLLILGAGIASITQLWIPREIILSIAENPLYAIGAMMALALVISVCSTVDAFIALAYANQFSPSALLGFLIYGPTIDIKALSMLTTTFKPYVVGIIWFLVTAFTLIITLGIASLGY